MQTYPVISAKLQFSSRPHVCILQSHKTLVFVIYVQFIRLLDIVVGGLMFYRDSIFFFLPSSFFYSSATLQARWTELNQNRPYVRK